MYILGCANFMAWYFLGSFLGFLMVIPILFTPKYPPGFILQNINVCLGILFFHLDTTYKSKMVNNFDGLFLIFFGRLSCLQPFCYSHFLSYSILSPVSLLSPFLPDSHPLSPPTCEKFKILANIFFGDMVLGGRTSNKTCSTF